MLRWRPPHSSQPERDGAGGHCGADADQGADIVGADVAAAELERRPRGEQQGAGPAAQPTRAGESEEGRDSHAHPDERGAISHRPADPPAELAGDHHGGEHRSEAQVRRQRPGERDEEDQDEDDRPEASEEAEPRFLRGRELLLERIVVGVVGRGPGREAQRHRHEKERDPQASEFLARELADHEQPQRLADDREVGGEHPADGAEGERSDDEGHHHGDDRVVPVVEQVLLGPLPRWELLARGPVALGLGDHGVDVGHLRSPPHQLQSTVNEIADQ
jgi:hypothetical protein